MYDIIFDFSSSPKGGSLRRLDAYALYFSNSYLKTKFLVHPNALFVMEKYINLNFSVIKKSYLDKILLNSKYLNLYRFRTKWFFSYGIPLKNEVGIGNWLHISNVLPFSNGDISLSLYSRIKILIQKYYFVKYSLIPTIISAESQFTIQQYQLFCHVKKFSILNNGINIINKNKIREKKFLINNNYAIAIGDSSYKRIDNTYSLFKKIKRFESLDYLVIVGQDKNVRKKYKNYFDIIYISNITDDDLYNIMNYASIFISTSEIENSSCAVLEASMYVDCCYLSNIPSHVELIDTDFFNILEKNKDYLKIQKNYLNNQKDKYFLWNHSIEVMLANMNFTK